ncbi:MAG: trypsin-like peptidase domain-containing protein [Planctomycetaceae bacterium]|nr:trypsin-like peptidase domain-containing protein [Planctomycetaceae bacterium]
MRIFSLCTFSTLLGTLVTVLVLEPSLILGNTALAQNQRPPIAAPAVGSAGDFSPSWYDREGLTPDEAVNVAVYERCNRSVVNISTVSIRTDRFFLTEVPEEGSGSGAILDQAGHVLTNFHVVQGAAQVNVTLYDEESYAAKLVGADPVNDIAVLKIDAPQDKLYPVVLGDSERLRVGMKVFALGNPFGLERTMSIGSVSSLNRTLEVQRNWVIKSIIQIDASINPGNSGGPLIDAHGRVIGMNTAIASRVAQSAGIGFAIPSNLISRVVPELIKYGRVIRGDIGITHVTVTDAGLRIARIAPGSPAELAGVRGPKVTRRGPISIIDRGAADIIVAVNGQPVKTAAEFLGIIESMKPKDIVRLGLLREGKPVLVDVTLADDSRLQEETSKF